MSKVIELEPIKHVYEIDQCAGCRVVIDDEYTEIGLPSGDGKIVKHIALCSKCTRSAEKAGVI